MMPADDFDPLAPETFTSAHELYKEMRQTCPVAHSNEWNGFWALLRYADVVGFLRDWDGGRRCISTLRNIRRTGARSTRSSLRPGWRGFPSYVFAEFFDVPGGMSMAIKEVISTTTS
jgi:cytochrome P450